jgi:hypothetical protein
MFPGVTAVLTLEIGIFLVFDWPWSDHVVAFALRAFDSRHVNLLY